MDERYSRNRLYITGEEQDKIKTTPILLAGSGIGSNIAECALRFGFEDITVVDGDVVELSNLNRQNYTEENISENKAEALCNRLKAINPAADIKFHSEFITPENIDEIVDNCQIAINALDFTSDVPLVFDELCQKKGITVLHPYNLGWGGLVTVITPDSLKLDSLTSGENFNELKMVEYVSGYTRFWGNPNIWLEKIIEDYKSEKENLPPPQLAVASWIVAGMCTHIMFNIVTQKKYKKFPEFYINSISN
ncbi:ThiF family protein [Cruoricaptor ignavus]|uniref:ThiF family protein n=1 Tax=Cruoricaptor ignavus TaxID=1118202 RepID=A0A1M6EW41_9FLAO|nr:ThiF family adenylyltransferase [Cruoricaptor ignavus]SHI89646.1 ThiF family protein [Cruoricaptor ignavus]